MSDPMNMSIEDILASCRQTDGAGGAASGDSSEAQADDTSVDESASGAVEEAATPAAKPSGKKPAEMSVAEMLAAARGEKSGAKPAAKAAPAKKAPAKKASAKKASQAAAAPKREGPMDTASILAAARKEAKPGPMTKAEAAAQGKSLPEGKKGKAKLDVPPMPLKPAYAQPVAAAAAAGEQDRRGFFASLTAVLVGSSLAVGFSSLALTHLLWVLGLARFMFPNILTEPPTRFKVGFPSDFATGQVETKFKAQFGVWIVRYEYEGVAQIYALQSVCTHLGCTPNWLEGEQKFKCPCHGSGFYKDGVNFEGPAPCPLERFAIRLADDGQLEVDKSRKFLEEKGEWKDRASFVQV